MTKIITAIGFDFGQKNIGLAYGQSLTQTAEPIGILKAQKGIPHWPELDQFMEQWKPHCLVVGLPLDKEKNIGDSAKAAKHFAETLEVRYHLPTYTIDESYTSVEAIAHYAPAKKARAQKRPMDGFAAKIILESWFGTL